MFISFIYQKIVGGLRGVAMERKSLNIVNKHVFICSNTYIVKLQPNSLVKRLGVDFVFTPSK